MPREVHAAGLVRQCEVSGMEESARAGHASPTLVPFRVMTYNVHGCAGTDGRYDIERIARVIAAHAPDVVALQELDVSRPRSGGSHQANRLAELLAMPGHFHPAWHIRAEEQYGDAILSRWPFVLRKAGLLPTAHSPLAFEPRGALWMEVMKEGARVQVLNTHLGLSWKERREQASELAGPQWLAHPGCVGPVVLCGDLNDVPRSRAVRTLAGVLRDAATHSPVRPRSAATFPSRLPLLRLDYVFVSADVTVQEVMVPRSPETRVASDHLPLVVDLLVPVLELGPEQAAEEAANLVREGAGTPQVHGNAL